MSLGCNGLTLDVVIPTFRGISRLRECLPALLGQLEPGDAVYVVDDASGDGTCEVVRREFPTVKVLVRERNGGFAKAANTGLRAGGGPLVAVVNDDCVVETGWRAAVVGGLARYSKAGALACLIARADDPSVVDSAGLIRTNRGFVQRAQGSDIGVADEPGWVLGPAGAAAVYRRSALVKVGFFDEALGSYYEDVDLALRLTHAGLRTRYEPAARARHSGGASFEHYSERHVRLCVRNQLVVMTTNLTWAMLVQILPGFIFDQLRSGVSLCLKHRRSGAWFSGLLGYAQMLPNALRTRALRVGRHAAGVPTDFWRHTTFVAQ